MQPVWKIPSPFASVFSSLLSESWPRSHARPAWPPNFDVSQIPYVDGVTSKEEAETGWARAWLHREIWARSAT